jgi:hypothetical protein
MSGHVFHPGHEALHGITVVLFTSGTRTFVGRYDQRESGCVVIHAADYHDSAKDAKSQSEWLAEVRKYGNAPRFPTLTVPEQGLERIVPLGELPNPS